MDKVDKDNAKVDKEYKINKDDKVDKDNKVDKEKVDKVDDVD